MSSLVHEAAFGLAKDLLHIFAGLLREEERPDAFAEVYEAVKKRLAGFEESVMHRAKRLNSRGERAGG